MTRLCAGNRWARPTSSKANSTGATVKSGGPRTPATPSPSPCGRASHRLPKGPSSARKDVRKGWPGWEGSQQGRRAHSQGIQVRETPPGGKDNCLVSTHIHTVNSLTSYRATVCHLQGQVAIERCFHRLTAFLQTAFLGCTLGVPRVITSEKQRGIRWLKGDFSQSLRARK